MGKGRQVGKFEKVQLGSVASLDKADRISLVDYPVATAGNSIQAG